MTYRAIHNVVFTLFAVGLAFFLSYVLTSLTELAYGYVIMRGDVNQMVSQGALVIADESLAQSIMNIDRLDAVQFGDELERVYGGSNNSWFFAAVGSWVVFWVLLYFTVFNWIRWYLDWKRLKLAGDGRSMCAQPIE